MKAIKNFLFVLAFAIPSTGHCMIPNRPRNNLPIRSLGTPPPGSLSTLFQKPLNVVDVQQRPTLNLEYDFSNNTLKRTNPITQEEFNDLADSYDYFVNQEALKQVTDILKNKRKEAEERYNQNKTPENIGAISTVDLALNRIEDPNTNIHSFEQLKTSNNQPEIALIKETLNPTVSQLTSNFLRSFYLDNTALVAVQNTWFKKNNAKALEDAFKVQEIIPRKRKQYPPHIEFAQSVLDTPKNIVRQGYRLAKDAPEKIAEPSMEAEKMYAESLGQGSGQMPRTYNFRLPQSRQSKQQTYSPAPKSAIKALEQEESFGLGYQ